MTAAGSVEAWLYSLARDGCSDDSLAQYRKTLRWAELRLGVPVAKATPGQWARFGTVPTNSTGRVKLRTLRRYLTWAGKPIPPLLVDGTGTVGRPGPPPRRRVLSPAWREAIDEWTTWYRSAGIGAGTVELRRSYLVRLGEDLRPAGPWDPTPSGLAAWLTGQNWASQTMRSALGSLRSFYGWGYAAGHNSTDPSRLLPKIRAKTYLPRPADDDDIGKALADATERVYLMIMLAARHGMRISEIAQAHTDDLIRVAGGWSLLAHGKGKKDRVIPLLDDAAAAIRDREPGWVFPNGKGSHLTARHVGVLISRQLPDGVTAHMCRHRFASVSYAGTHDLRAVQTLLGHASPSTTMVYTALSDQQLRAAVQAASRIG